MKRSLTLIRTGSVQSRLSTCGRPSNFRPSIFNQDLRHFLNDYELYYRPTEETSELRECPQWQLSAFVVTLAWINLLIYMRQIPVLGKYITIFHEVLYTFLRVATIILVFVVAVDKDTRVAPHSSLCDRRRRPLKSSLSPTFRTHQSLLEANREKSKS